LEPLYFLTLPVTLVAFIRPFIRPLAARVVYSGMQEDHGFLQVAEGNRNVDNNSSPKCNAGNWQSPRCSLLVYLLKFTSVRWKEKLVEMIGVMAFGYFTGIIVSLGKVAMTGSTYITIAISVERFLGLVYPLEILRTGRPRSLCRYFIPVFVLTIVINVPILYVEVWSSKEKDTAYQMQYCISILELIFTTVIPLVVLIFCNVGIFRHLRRESTKRDQMTNSSRGGRATNFSVASRQQSTTNNHNHQHHGTAATATTASTANGRSLSSGNNNESIDSGWVNGRLGSCRHFFRRQPGSSLTRALNSRSTSASTAATAASTASPPSSGERSLAVVLLGIVLVFLVCHGPRFVQTFNEATIIDNILRCAKRKLVPNHPSWLHVMAPISDFLLVVNSSVNFIIYCAVGSRFRNAVTGRIRRSTAQRRALMPGSNLNSLRRSQGGGCGGGSHRRSAGGGGFGARNANSFYSHQPVGSNRDADGDTPLRRQLTYRSRSASSRRRLFTRSGGQAAAAAANGQLQQQQGHLQPVAKIMGESSSDGEIPLGLVAGRNFNNAAGSRRSLRVVRRGGRGSSSPEATAAATSSLRRPRLQPQQPRKQQQRTFPVQYKFRKDLNVPTTLTTSSYKTAAAAAAYEAAAEPTSAVTAVKTAENFSAENRNGYDKGEVRNKAGP